MLTYRTWLPALVWIALLGCSADTTPAASDGALAGSTAPDATSDAATPRPSSPPRASGDILTPFGSDGVASEAVDAGTWDPPTCGDQAEQLSVAGSSPLGPLNVTSVGVRYWSGFTYGTGLRLEGMVGDQRMVLTAEAATSPNEAGLRPELPPGQYRPGNNWDDLYVTLTTGESDVSLGSAELTIERHDSASPLTRGSPIELRGRLKVFEPGWSLDVPFAITSVCETVFEGGAT